MNKLIYQCPLCASRGTFAVYQTVMRFVNATGKRVNKSDLNPADDDRMECDACGYVSKPYRFLSAGG